MWSQILDFLYNNWFKLGLLIWLFYLVSSFGKEWFKTQIEWVKWMFVDDEDASHINNAPSHKNAILLALVIVFIIAFLRKIALETSPDIPDIPTGWQLVILAGLGIAAAKSGAQKLFENKWKNGNGNGATPPNP